MKKLKLLTDIVMTVLLMLLMAYSLVGEKAHEIIGIAMFILFILHHILNRRWILNLTKGKYSPIRVWQTALVAAIFCTMTGQAISGIMISRYIFSVNSGMALARTVHLLCAYWGFCLMGMHLGLHWNQMIPQKLRKTAVRILGYLAAAYGLLAFFKRGLLGYMLLLNRFVFFDTSEPLVLFFIDYIAIMGLFICIGHIISTNLRRKV